MHDLVFNKEKGLFYSITIPVIQMGISENAFMITNHQTGSWGNGTDPMDGENHHWTAYFIAAFTNDECIKSLNFLVPCKGYFSLI